MIPKTVTIMICFVCIYAGCGGIIVTSGANAMNLPKTIGAWTRPDSARIIHAADIFKYMNGAGELYLSYGFDRLEVFEYTADTEKGILVELYYMNTSDDAFGLLSLDWTGDPVTFDVSPAGNASQAIAPSTRALYGKGLLRMCSDTVYARIMAYQETPAAKKAVSALGKTIYAQGKYVPEPALLRILKKTVNGDSNSGDWHLKHDGIGYFRSYLVLNSLYYLGHQNILNLDHTSEAVTAPYEKNEGGANRKRMQFLFVKYTDSRQAEQALKQFHDIYLPEHGNDMGKNPNFFKIEDGWLGYKRTGPGIAFVFECPDEKIAEMFMNRY